MTTDRERFEDLFERCYDALMAYAVRRTASADDAADVVSETFTTAWRRVAELPPGDEARLWLYGTARRVVRNQRRGLRRREALDERLLLHARTVFAHVRAADADSPDGGLLAALGDLSETDQELLRLTAWEGLDGPEVARVLGISPTAARVRLHRARTRLRARWLRRVTAAGMTGAAGDPARQGSGDRPTDRFVPVVGRPRVDDTAWRTR